MRSLECASWVFDVQKFLHALRGGPGARLLPLASALDCLLAVMCENTVHLERVTWGSVAARSVVGGFLAETAETVDGGLGSHSGGSGEHPSATSDLPVGVLA